MYSLQIDNPEIEQYIHKHYKDNDVSLVNDFLVFLKTEMVSKEIKKGFKEVEQYKGNKTTLNDATSFLETLKSEN